ncbi:MAG TPA: methyltransferase [Solirubrobacteraceae bacterium]|nr:methyltransferase [Solirubrobacteraceae bacterium]
MPDSRDVNLANWEERVPAHAASADYALERFRSDPAFLSGVVRFDLPLLGDIGGLRGLHLQCHIGTDTLSLARLGARMTGLDFSPAALEQARRLAADVGADIEYVQADAYDAVEVLGRGRFDLLYTGIGAICWLPRIERWAQVVTDLLAPGGRLFIREGHPMLWSLQDVRNEGKLLVEYPYFETEEPLVFTEGGTYVETETVFDTNETHNWNHGLGEILTALISRGMRVTGFAEHDSVPWDALPGMMERLDSGEFRLKDRPSRLACSYTLQAFKDA